MTSPFLSFPCWLTSCPFGLCPLFFFLLKPSCDSLEKNSFSQWAGISDLFTSELQYTFHRSKSSPKYTPDSLLKPCQVLSDFWCFPSSPSVFTSPGLLCHRCYSLLIRVLSLKRTCILEDGLCVFWKVSRRYCIAGGIMRNNVIGDSSLLSGVTRVWLLVLSCCWLCCVASAFPRGSSPFLWAEQPRVFPAFTTGWQCKILIVSLFQLYVYVPVCARVSACDSIVRQKIKTSTAFFPFWKQRYTGFLWNRVDCENTEPIRKQCCCRTWSTAIFQKRTSAFFVCWLCI